jgi:hypothetical protein
MAATCAAQGARFSVVLLPAGAAYRAGRYELADMYDRLLAFLAAEGIPASAPIDAFAVGTASYFDTTDHLYEVGNEHMAGLLEGFLGELGIEPGSDRHIAGAAGSGEAAAEEQAR